MLKEEKHTANAVAFAIDLGEKNQAAEAPLIKKRLEAAPSAPSITLDQI